MRSQCMLVFRLYTALLIEACCVYVTISIFNCDLLPEVCDVVGHCQHSNVTDMCAGTPAAKCCVTVQQTGLQYLTVLTYNNTVGDDDIRLLSHLLQHHINISGFIFTSNTTIQSTYNDSTLVPLPTHLCDLHQLQVLFIGTGYWSVTAPCFNNMQRLRVLAIQGKAKTQVTMPLTELFSNLTSLELLSFSSRRTDACQSFQPSKALFRYSDVVPQLKLSTLRLVNFYPEEYLPDDLLLGLDTLQEVHLTENGFITVPRAMFANTYALKVMNLSLNRIEYLPVGLFDKLPLLEKVDFERNTLLYINPLVFVPLSVSTKLKEINLSYNGIIDISVNKQPETYSQTNILVKLSNVLSLSNEVYIRKALHLLHERDEASLLPITLHNSSIRIVRVKFEANYLTTLPRVLDALNIAIDGVYPGLLTHDKTHYVITVSRLLEYMCTCEDINYFSSYSHFHFVDADQMSCKGPITYKPLFPLEQSNFVKNDTCSILQATQEDCPKYLECAFDLNKNAISILTTTSNLDLQVLPLTVPPLPTLIGAWNNFIRSYYIDLSASGIAILQWRDYLKYTIFLNLSYNHITHISDNVSQMLATVPTIYLNDNLLTSLPKSMQVIDVNSSAVGELHLYNNPWSCDCHSVWMKRWLLDLGSVVVHPKLITCAQSDVRRGKPLIELEDDKFQCYYIMSVAQYTTLVAGSSTLGLAAVATAICWVVYRKRHWMYATLNVHPFDMDECNGESMRFDMFVSYANEDERFIEDFIAWLETDQHFSVCYHRRDFLPGSGALDNIERAVTRSRRTVCYVTPDFLNSEWCIWEFITALNLDLEHKRQRLIVIKDAALQVDTVANVSVKEHLKRFTFIDRGSAHFTHQLLYSLPQKRLHQQTLLLDTTQQLEVEEY